VVPPKKVHAVHRALDAAAIPHAVGGALALGFHGAPRATVDIDVNVFVPVERWAEVGRALAPLGVEVEVDAESVTREREVRLGWDENPVHLFFSYDELHAAMPAAVREVPFAGTTIPIVAPEHLVVRKALLDRPKDWPDIEAILVAAEPLDVEKIERWLERLAGPDDPRVARLRELAGRPIRERRPGRR